MRIDNKKVVVIAEEDLKTIFDLAVNSLDFGSGFWDQPEVDVARRLAEILGLDPFGVATPREMKANYPHVFVPIWHSVFCRCGRCTSHTAAMECGECRKEPDWMNHVEEVSDER